jgi:hypothetical protein
VGSATQDPDATICSGRRLTCDAMSGAADIEAIGLSIDDMLEIALCSKGPRVRGTTPTDGPPRRRSLRRSEILPPVAGHQLGSWSGDTAGLSRFGDT